MSRNDMIPPAIPPIALSAWDGELQKRRVAVESILEEHDCQALVAYGTRGFSENFRYLANFEPIFDGWLILGDDGFKAGVLKFHYQLDEARVRSGIDDWHGEFDPAPVVGRLLSERGVRRVGFTGLDRHPVTAYWQIEQSPHAPAILDVGASVSALRRIKSDFEISVLHAAARITDVAHEVARQEVRVGMTENEVSARLAQVLQSLNGMPSLPPYVLSGNDNPTIVREPSMRPLTRGDAVMIDMVGSFEGYQADIARTFVLGTATAEQRRIWAVLERAFDAVLAIVRPGVRCADLHTAAASVIADAGYALPHRIGHGIGLAHSFEWPSLDTEEALLEAGMTICIEPGIYVRGAGSMKIEDEVLVTPQGSELLTHATRNLEVAC